MIGTRPEAIKMAPIVHELASDPLFDPRIICTGQHRELLSELVDVLELRTDLNLDLMVHAQSLAHTVGEATSRLGAYWRGRHPDLVLVQGDTGSALGAALAAYYEQIPIGHVEAGLRTFDPAQPFPEETNRVLISRLASMHFCPTEANRANLLAEGVPAERIFVTGNTGIDSFLRMWHRVRPQERAGKAEPRRPGRTARGAAGGTPRARGRRRPPGAGGNGRGRRLNGTMVRIVGDAALRRLDRRRRGARAGDPAVRAGDLAIGAGRNGGSRRANGRGRGDRLAGKPGDRRTRLVLVTAHRRENADGPFVEICRALRRIARLGLGARIVFPVHPGPRLRRAAQEHLGDVPEIEMVHPLRYDAFVTMMSQADLIVTDSGGIQEEACAVGKPTLVLRNVTERQEGETLGSVRVIGTGADDIADAVRRLLTDDRELAELARPSACFGDGKAARRVHQAVRHVLRGGDRPRDYRAAPATDGDSAAERIPRAPRSNGRTARI